MQEGVKLIIVLLDNRGFAVIGGLQMSVGTPIGFGTNYRYRTRRPASSTATTCPIDFAANAASLGAAAMTATNETELETPWSGQKAKRAPSSSTSRSKSTPVPGFDSWWDVPVAEVSAAPEGRPFRAAYESKSAQKRHITPS